MKKRDNKGCIGGIGCLVIVAFFVLMGVLNTDEYWVYSKPPSSLTEEKENPREKGTTNALEYKPYEAGVHKIRVISVGRDDAIFRGLMPLVKNWIAPNTAKAELSCWLEGKAEYRTLVSTPYRLRNVRTGRTSKWKQDESHEWIYNVSAELRETRTGKKVSDIYFTLKNSTARSSRDKILEEDIQKEVPQIIMPWLKYYVETDNVNINTATKEEILEIFGCPDYPKLKKLSYESFGRHYDCLGELDVEQLCKARTEHGPIYSLEEFKELRGLWNRESVLRFLDNNLDRIIFEVESPELGFGKTVKKGGPKGADR